MSEKKRAFRSLTGITLNCKDEDFTFIVENGTVRGTIKNCVESGEPKYSLTEKQLVSIVRFIANDPDQYFNTPTEDFAEIFRSIEEGKLIL